jgi:hypothetical protein
VNLLLEAYQQLLTEEYEIEGVDSLAIDGFGTVRTQPEPYAQVEDRDKFRQWCIEAGLERSLALPWQTTNALTKQRLMEGLPEPDGVKATVKTKIVFTKER